MLKIEPEIKKASLPQRERARERRKLALIPR